VRAARRGAELTLSANSHCDRTSTSAAAVNRSVALSALDPSTRVTASPAYEKRYVVPTAYWNLAFCESDSAQDKKNYETRQSQYY